MVREKAERFITEVSAWEAEQTRDESEWFVSPTAARHCSEHSREGADEGQASASMTVSSANVSVNKPLHTFLSTLEVDGQKLLTDDVLQHRVFVHELEEFSRVFIRYSSARSTYENNLTSGITSCWKQSSVKESLAKAATILTAVDQKLQEIAAIHINPVAMLSVQTQLTVQRKAKLVTDAVLTFSALGKDLVACTRPVEIRNSQVAHRLHQDITNKVIANE